MIFATFNWEDGSEWPKMDTIETGGKSRDTYIKKILITNLCRSIVGHKTI